MHILKPKPKKQSFTLVLSTSLERLVILICRYASQFERETEILVPKSRILDQKKVRHSSELFFPLSYDFCNFKSQMPSLGDVAALYLFVAVSALLGEGS